MPRVFASWSLGGRVELVIENTSQSIQPSHPDKIWTFYIPYHEQFRSPQTTEHLTVRKIQYFHQSALVFGCRKSLGILLLTS